MLTELVKQVDAFIERYGTTGSDKAKMKTDLWELVQKAVDLGAEKDQSKISGIVGKVIKSFMGGGKD